MNVKNKIFKILFSLLIIFSLSPIIFAEESASDEGTNDTVVVDEYIKEIIPKEDENTTDEEITTIGAEDYAYINPATNYKVVIEDDANLLSDTQIEDLKRKMIELTEYGNIMFKSINYNNTSTSTYASDYYHGRFGTASGSLFLIDMDKRQIYIFSDGANYNTITSNKAYSITDNVYRYASRERYFDCAYEAYDEMLTLLGGNKIAEPMKYTSNALLAIICAAFINFFIVMKVSKIKDAKDKDILSKCNIKFDVGEVTAEKTGTKKVYSPPSDSGGSSGGGGGGGGGSSGGGGGHGF